MSNNEQSDKEEVTENIKILSNFVGLIEIARRNTREEYKKKESKEECILRINLDSLFARFAEQTKDKIEIIDENTSFQLTISASYIRTHFIISDLIMDGHLVEATVLIRKQLEALCRLHELDSKPLSKLLKKTPNVKNILKGKSGTVYGILSEIAHSSSHRIGSLLDTIEKNDKIAISLLPTYSVHSHGAWDLDTFVNIYYLHWQFEKFKIWYPKKSFDIEKKYLALSIQIAIEEGVIQVDKNQ